MTLFLMICLVSFLCVGMRQTRAPAPRRIRVEETRRYRRD
jgi:hypothetical protein